MFSNDRPEAVVALFPTIRPSELSRLHARQEEEEEDESRGTAAGARRDAAVSSETASNFSSIYLSVFLFSAKNSYRGTGTSQSDEASESDSLRFMDISNEPCIE